MTLAAAPAPFAWGEAQADARGRGASRDPLQLLSGVVGAADAVVVFTLSMLAFVLRHGLEPVPLEVISTSALASLLVANALSISGAYKFSTESSLLAQTWHAVQAWTIVFVLLLAIGFLTKTSSDYARIWAVLWYLSVLLGLAMVRLAAVRRLSRWRSRGRLTSTVAIVDLAGRGVELARRLSREPDCRLLGVFYADDAASPRRNLNGLVALSQLFRIDEVFVLVADHLDAAKPNALSAILRRLGTMPTNVRLCPPLPPLGQMPIRDVALVHDIPVITVHRRPLGAWSSIVKRAEDLILGSTALIFLLPLMLLIALAVKLDSRGPVLFRQARQGFNNNVITVLKFRSMHHLRDDGGQVLQAVRNDRRVTRVGRFLRRTSLDELPQIFNVLRGEMSLVGPRPHAVVHNQQYAALIDDYLGRHRVQPGITGWAQVSGLRGETETVDKMQKRVEYDLAYIDNWSIILDLKIMLLTVMTILVNRDVY